MNPYLKRLSHVGIRTSDLDASLKWYTEVLGLKEAFRLERDGRVVIVYLHLTQNTFIELFAPRPDQAAPPKTHFSIEVTDIEGAVQDILPRLPDLSVRKREITTGMDGSRLFNFFDLDGHRIEFQEFPPESQEAQAMARWEK